MKRLTKTYVDGSYGVADDLPCGENSHEFKKLLVDKLASFEERGWISVDEGLPESLEIVLVYVSVNFDHAYDFQSTGSVYPNKTWTWHRNAIIYPSAKVTHWMPLPKAPESTESA